MTAKRRNPDLETALKVVAEHLGRHLVHGDDATGTIRVGSLDVAISIRPRNVVEQRDVEHFRREALAQFAQWGSGCAEYVRDRGGWSGRSSSRRCRQPVVAAVVRRSRLDSRPCFSFCCRTHLAAESKDTAVLGTLSLSPPEVAAARKERERRAELRARGVIVPGDRPEVDTAIECAILTLAAVLRATADRRAA